MIQYIQATGTPTTIYVVNPNQDLFNGWLAFMITMIFIIWLFRKNV